MSAGLYHYSALQGRRLHLGVCGSVAAYKALDLMRALQKAGVAVSVTLTDAARRFVSPLSFEALGADPVYTRMFGEDMVEGNIPLFAHLQPGQCAHAMMIAPASAATLARIAAGFADDLLAAQVLAFTGPVALAPAMNPRMWANPATRSNVELLRKRGFIFVRPATGLVACGDEGEGKLPDNFELSLAAARALLPQDLAGKKVLVTLGPTREQWDGVRVWTNLSTGLMGASLVQAAWLRGAEVHAVAGPGVPALPAGVVRHDVNSALEMFDASKEIWREADLGLFTAAVADFRPEAHGSAKFKKQGAEEGFSVRFLPNPDILATLAEHAGPDRKILGFAAESENLEQRTRDKLRRKKAHLLAGNLVGRPDSGFASARNTMFVCDARGREEHWPPMSKADVAWRLLDWLLTL